MTVPCRYVYAKLHSLLMRSFHKLFHHVTLPVTPRAVRNVVVGGLGGPEAKTIVVLSHRYQPFEPGRLGRTGNLIGIEVQGIEQIRRRITKTPLLVLKGSGSEMDKAIELHFMPVQLRCCWCWSIGGWCILQLTVGGVAGAHGQEHHQQNRLVIFFPVVMYHNEIWF